MYVCREVNMCDVCFSAGSMSLVDSRMRRAVRCVLGHLPFFGLFSVETQTDGHSCLRFGFDRSRCLFLDERSRLGPSGQIGEFGSFRAF